MEEKRSAAAPCCRRYGQLILGPPGSGKSTYCKAAAGWLERRRPALINLDPAAPPSAGGEQPFDVDVRELCGVGPVQEAHGLGPNGALLWCMEYLHANVGWLLSRLEGLEAGRYLLFDTPGQVEVYTCADGFKKVVEALQTWGLMLVVVHMVDSACLGWCGSLSSALLLSLSAMLYMGLPHVNVLSKADAYQPVNLSEAIDAEMVTDWQEQHVLAACLVDRVGGRRKRGAVRTPHHPYRKLVGLLAGVVEEEGLVDFISMSVGDEAAVRRVLAAADRAIGLEPNSVQRAAGLGEEWERVRTSASLERGSG